MKHPITSERPVENERVLQLYEFVPADSDVSYMLQAVDLPDCTWT
jgi:hypothetical protein